MIDVKDIKEKIDKMVDRIKNDDTLKEQFKKDPIKAVESVLGVDLPDEAVKKIISETKEKLAGGGEKAGSVAGKAVEKAGDVAGKAVEKAGDVAEKAGDILGGAAGKVTDVAGGLVDSIKKKL